MQEAGCRKLDAGRQNDKKENGLLGSGSAVSDEKTPRTLT
jgi:hypothetical protein